jgi:NADH-quinone oxidoreductase subunit H
VVFWISAVAETNRAPFDLPEAESELVAGYHTEYSGMKFAYFYMAEYAHMVLASSLVVLLFFGGWLPPFQRIKILHAVPGFLWYLIKIMFFLYLYVWIRATFPRYRFDSLIRLVWKWLIPLALVNFVAVVLVRFLR